MRLRRLVLGTLPLPALLALTPTSGCGRDASEIGLVLRTPQGTLDKAAQVKLSVFDAKAAACLPTGHVSKIPASGTQSFTLQHDGCGAGVAWCKDIELDRNGAQKMFAVVATDAVGGTVAEGCTKATIDQDPLEVDITVQRYNEPACCNDGKLQIGEQCDLGVPATTDCTGAPVSGACTAQTPDPVCECDCLAKEIALDRVVDPPPVPLTKIQPAMAFAQGTGQLDLSLRAVFTDTTSGASNTSDVIVRDLTKDLYPITDPLPLAGPLKIPLLCSNPAAKGLSQNQREPSIASVSQTATAVVFLWDQTTGGLFYVYLSHQTDVGCADAQPLRVNVTDKLSLGPDVSGGPADLALVTWTTKDNEVLGRIWQSTDGVPDPLLPADADIPIAINATGAKVAGTKQGWVVVYTGAGPGDGDGVFFRAVSKDGTVSSETKVNLATDGPQDQPDIAAFGDGRVLVTWRSAGDIFFQRFAADGTPNPEDQASPIHAVTDGDQSSPTAAAGGDFGDFFVVAWENRADGTVWARNIGGSTGFVYNSVTGQNDAYNAAHPGHVAGVRRSPMVAIGGGGYVAIGWQDDNPTYPGIYARRFPLPAL